MQIPVPRRAFSFRHADSNGKPRNVPLTPGLLEDARRYALGWKEMFGRYPQGQHPLKFPVNRQIRLDEADLILEFPAELVELK